jgi:hypothetical protein
MPVALLEQAQGVDEAGVEEILKALAFFVGDAVLAVGFRVREP